MMDGQESQNIAQNKYAETWTSFAHHEFTNHYDQAERFLPPQQFLNDESLQTLSPYNYSLHSCQSPSTLSLSSEDRPFFLERADSRSRTSHSASSSLHTRYRKSLPEGTTIVADKHARRKQQNRNAQRAFRSRQEAQQKNLEDQLDDLKQKYAKLINSFTTQCTIVSQLRATISDLSTHIVSMQATMCNTPSPVDISMYGTESFVIDDMRHESSYY